MKNIISGITILLFIIIFVACSPASQIQHKITFQVIVKNPFDNQKVYIGLNWETGAPTVSCWTG